MHIECHDGMQLKVPNFIGLDGQPMHRPTSHAPWRPAKDISAKREGKQLTFAAVWHFPDGHFHAWTAERLDDGAGDWQIGHEIQDEDADAMMANAFPELYLPGYQSHVIVDGQAIQDPGPNARHYLSNPAARAAKLSELKALGYSLEDDEEDEPLIVLRNWFNCKI